MARLGTANSMGTILGPRSVVPWPPSACWPRCISPPAWRAGGIDWCGGNCHHTAAGPDQPPAQARLRYTDRASCLLLATAVGLFVGFSGIQQTLGFQLQDKLGLSGIETAQMTGAALMVSAAFTFLIQVTVMQRVKLKPTQFVRLGLLSLLFGAAVISSFDTFAVLAVGMAFLGAGLGCACRPFPPGHRWR